MKAHGNDTVLPQKDGSFLLECPISKGWIGRKLATRTSAEHPGTAVRWEGEIFEVLEATPGARGGTRYRLAPWEGHHAIRVVTTYDGATESARVQEQRQRLWGIRNRRVSILLAPLVGHLPAEVQLCMEGDFGAPARWMTLASAFPLFVLGLLRVLENRIASVGGGPLLPSWLALPFPLAAYLAFESAVRLWVAFIVGDPLGSVVGVLLYELWRLITGHSQPMPLRPAPPRWEPSDTYRMLEPLLALLSPKEQELLERQFSFPLLRWGRASAILVGVVAVLNVIISLGTLAQGGDTFWDFCWLIAGTYLFVEQVLRLRRIGRGHPAGSVLGALVRPLARRILAPAAGG